jgi:hypothetical protein
VSPVLFASSTSVLAGLIILKSPLTSHLAWYWALTGVAACFLAAMLLAHFFFVPAIWQRIVSSAIDERSASTSVCVLMFCRYRFDVTLSIRNVGETFVIRMSQKH